MLTIESLPESLQAPVYELLGRVLSRGGLLPFVELPDNLLPALGVCNGLDRAWTEMKGRMVCLTMAGQAAFELHEASLAPPKVRRPRQGKTKAIPSAASETVGDEGNVPTLPAPDPYPVRVANVEPIPVRIIANDAGTTKAEPSLGSLNDNEYTVLRALRAKKPRQVLIPDLAADTGIGEKTCKQIINSLIRRGLVDRPTKRGGATITPAGEAILAAADASHKPVR
jgi:DNA-binding MarR family transcriptional regulator